jgi:putative transposase
MPLFNNDAIKDAFVDHLSMVQQALKFDLHAWVIMPEHFHLLLRPKQPSAPHTGGGMVCGTHEADASIQTVTQILRRLKSSFGKQIIERWRELDAPILARITNAQGRQQFWQAGGGYDRNIFTDQELTEKISYIHQNPIRRGLVESPTAYRWSSARFYDGLSYVGPVIARIL